MAKLLKFTLKVIIIVVIVAAVVFALARLPLGPVSNVAKSAELELLTIFDKNEVTKRVAQEMITAESEALSEAMNITEEQATRLLANIDFAGWTTTTLPADAVVTKTIAGSPLGIEGTITLYASNDYITLAANGQQVTLTVPEDARRAVSYLYIV